MIKNIDKLDKIERRIDYIMDTIADSMDSDPELYDAVFFSPEISEQKSLMQLLYETKDRIEKAKKQ
jgi:hypothetical protein